MCNIEKQNKNMTLKVRYLKLPIGAYRVIIIFEFSDVYLIDTAKKIFRKSPKMVFLKNVLILLHVFYFIDLTTLTKK